MITDIARLASVNEILLFYMRAKLRKGWFINVGVFRDANSKKVVLRKMVLKLETATRDGFIRRCIP